MKKTSLHVAIIGSFALMTTMVCRADQVYVQAGVDGNGFPNLFDQDQNGIPRDNGSFADYWNQGITSATASGSHLTSTASASISLTGPDAGIHLFSQATSEPVGQFSASAGVEWKDVIHLDGAATLPQTIRVAFEVNGILKLDLAPQGRSADAHVYLMSLSPSGNFDLTSVAPSSIGHSGVVSLSGVEISLQNTPYVNPLNASDFRYDPISGATHWVATFDLPYIDLYGGYVLNILTDAQVLGYFGGGVTADLSHTIHLTGVTMSDGSAIPGGVTVESGFQVNALSVPEPSSMIMMGIAGPGILLLIRRRRITA